MNFYGVYYLRLNDRLVSAIVKCMRYAVAVNVFNNQLLQSIMLRAQCIYLNDPFTLQSRTIRKHAL